MEDLAFRLLLNNPLVYKALQTISRTSTVKALVIDAFCTSAVEVAKQLNLPCFYFFTSGISVLALFLNLQTIHNSTKKSIKDLEGHLVVPGLPPILPTDMPQPFIDRTDKVYDHFVEISVHLSKSDGIIVNTFESLEPRALKAVMDGLCVPDSRNPPVFCIGPLIADHNDGSDEHECLKWLDSHPSQSVVFLCFGSLGLFTENQLKEIAIGLENSEQRFLWVVRSPPTQDKVKRFLAPPEPNLETLLPAGFLDRTKDRGLVVKSWAPQTQILLKDSVGGFVTHCGWNSVLEAIDGGVPMVAWPLYAEQQVNRVLLVEEMKVALPMDESKDRFVKASEVEKRIRSLMESDEGKLVRKQTIHMRDDAKLALNECGSSQRALSELVELWNSERQLLDEKPNLETSLEGGKPRMFTSKVPKLEAVPANIRMST